MRVLQHPVVRDIELVTVLAALSDPTRLAVAVVLADGDERSAAAIGTAVGVGGSVLSHHLGVLRQAGLIHIRVAGRSRLSTLRTTDLDSRFPGLLSAVLSGAVSAHDESE